VITLRVAATATHQVTSIFRHVVVYRATAYARCCSRISVCLSVCLSVCQTRALSQSSSTPMSVPIESPYWWSIQTDIISRTVSKLSDSNRHIDIRTEWKHQVIGYNFFAHEWYLAAPDPLRESNQIKSNQIYLPAQNIKDLYNSFMLVLLQMCGRSTIKLFYFTFILVLLPRCMQCRRGLAMRFLSVRPSVRPSVCLSVRLSVKRVHCDKTEERYV